MGKTKTKSGHPNYSGADGDLDTEFERSFFVFLVDDEPEPTPELDAIPMTR